MPRLCEKANLWYRDCTIFHCMIDCWKVCFSLDSVLVYLHYVETPNFSQTQQWRFGGNATAEDCDSRRRRGCLLLVQCLLCPFSMTVWFVSSFLARWGVAGSWSTSASTRCDWWLIYAVKAICSCGVVVLWRLLRDCMVTSWRSSYFCVPRDGLTMQKHENLSKNHA